jgi:hypothetical protein
MRAAGPCLPILTSLSILQLVCLCQPLKARAGECLVPQAHSPDIWSSPVIFSTSALSLAYSTSVLRCALPACASPILLQHAYSQRVCDIRSRSLINASIALGPALVGYHPFDE